MQNLSPSFRFFFLSGIKMLLGLTSHSQDCASIFCFPFQPVLFIFEV